MLRAFPGPLSRDIKVQAYLPDGVVISAKDVAVPSQASFAQLVGYRDDTEPLSYGVVANAVQTLIPAVHRSIFVSFALRRPSIALVTDQHAAPCSGIVLSQSTPVNDRHLDQAALTREFTSNVILPSDTVADPRMLEDVARESSLPLISIDDPCSFTSVVK
ncbi:unnamed protein product [Heligmosomoides polygyrus]|uniref:GNAT family N-acetyltransferase n=1 Tax=Heligmosomoides polygyrus TaxID=6339 RepID=A0A183G7T5_HELPZ|nr:unnamed protein product [Heligmosomoides polygyrus]